MSLPRRDLETGPTAIPADMSTRASSPNGLTSSTRRSCGLRAWQLAEEAVICEPVWAASCPC